MLDKDIGYGFKLSGYEEIVYEIDIECAAAHILQCAPQCALITEYSLLVPEKAEQDHHSGEGKQEINQRRVDGDGFFEGIN